MIETLKMRDEPEEEINLYSTTAAERIKWHFIESYSHADPRQFEQDFIERSAWYDQQSLRMQALITRFPFLS